MIVTRKLLESLKFKQFNKDAYKVTSIPELTKVLKDCQSPVPLIGSNDDYIIVIDGEYCKVLSNTTEPEILETCLNIRKLSK